MANDSVLDDLNMGCVDCQPPIPLDATCATTTFVGTPFVDASAVIIPIEHDDYIVCCDPVAIKPFNYVQCARGAVKLINYEIVNVPTKGNLYIGDEIVANGDVLTEQENGLLVYKRTIDPNAEEGLQEADTDSFDIEIVTTGGTSDELTINLVLEEATCIVPSPCGGCGC